MTTSLALLLLAVLRRNDPPAREQFRPPGVSGDRESMNAGNDLHHEQAEKDPDLETVMAAREGDGRAFEKIVLKYQGPAYNIARRMLSDREEARDLTQDVFIRVYRSLGSFRSDSRFSHWFYTVLLNACRSRMKHLRRRGFFRTDPLDEPAGGNDDRPPRQWADASPSPAAVAEKKQLEELVQERMNQVPEEYREILLLRDVQGFAYEEIAAVLGMNVGTVKSRLHRGRMALKSLLAGDLEGVV